MKKQLVKHALVVSLIFASVFAFSQDAALLKYNFVKGKTYVLSTKLNNDVTQTMGGQEVKMETGISFNSEMLIEGVDNSGSATTVVTLKNASIYTKIPAMGRDTTMNFNDLNEQRRVVYSSTGKQISVVSITPEKILKMLGSIDQFTNLQYLPEKSFYVGDKWNDIKVDSTKASQQSPVNMNISTDMEYTLAGKEVKDGIELLKISYSGVLSITGKGNMQGMELFVEGSGKTEGFSYFNTQTSMVVYNEANTEMDMSIAVSGQQNMTMPMSQSLKIITTIEEKK